jgi:hypothetical protein
MALVRFRPQSKPNPQQAIAALEKFGLVVDDASIEAYLDAWESGTSLPGRSREYACARVVAKQALQDLEQTAAEEAEQAGYRMQPADYYRIADVQPEEVDAPEPAEQPPTDPIRRAYWDHVHGTETPATTGQTPTALETNDIQELYNLGLHPGEGAEK